MKQNRNASPISPRRHCCSVRACRTGTPGVQKCGNGRCTSLCGRSSPDGHARQRRIPNPTSTDHRRTGLINLVINPHASCCAVVATNLAGVRVAPSARESPLATATGECNRLIVPNPSFSGAPLMRAHAPANAATPVVQPQLQAKYPRRKATVYGFSLTPHPAADTTNIARLRITSAIRLRINGNIKTTPPPRAPSRVPPSSRALLTARAGTATVNTGEIRSVLNLRIAFAAIYRYAPRVAGVQTPKDSASVTATAPPRKRRRSVLIPIQFKTQHCATKPCWRAAISCP